MQNYFTSTSKYTRSLIFGFLRAVDLAPLFFVSKKMHEYVREYCIEAKTIKIRDSDLARLNKTKDFKLFFSTFPKISCLKINTFSMTSEIFQYLPKSISTLHILNCKESIVRDSLFYQNILDRISPCLKNLKIEYNEDDKEYGIIPSEFLLTLKDFAANLKLLINLEVHIIFKTQHKYYTRSMTNLLFYTFHQHSPSVQYMHFNYLVVIPSLPKANTVIKAIKAEASDGFCPKFEESNIVFGVNSATLNLLATQFRDLEEIHITDHLMVKKSLSDELVSNLIEKHPNLRTFFLNCYRDKFSVPDTCIMHTVSSLNSIQKLGLASCKNLCVSSILSVTQNFLKIRYLNLDFTDIDDNDIANMTDMLDKLEFLSLKCCFKITDDGFDYLCQHLTNLKTGNFKYVKSFGSQALSNLIDSAKNLKKLKLANNSVSNEDLFNLLQKVSHLSELTWSAMNCSDDFTQECFYQSVQQNVICWRLKSLDLSQNHLIDDVSITQLCELNLPSLSYLSLNRCRNLTKVAIRTLSISRLGDKLIVINFAIEGVNLLKEEFGQIFDKMKKLASISLSDCQRHRFLMSLYENCIDITLL